MFFILFGHRGHVYYCGKFIDALRNHGIDREEYSQGMIQGILCSRIDCCDHEIAGSDDGIVNLWAHTFGPSRVQKNETRHMYCQSSLLFAFVTISCKDQRRRASNPSTLLFPFPNIPFTNRFREFSTAICRRDGLCPLSRQSVILQDIVPKRILALTFSDKVLLYLQAKDPRGILSFASEFITSNLKIASKNSFCGF